jgi:hypothetical protein
MIRRLAEKLWSASRKESRMARTVVLKLKTSEFKILTCSHTSSAPPSSCEELTAIVLALRERVDLGPQQRFRLIGVGLSNFREPGDAAPEIQAVCDERKLPMHVFPWSLEMSRAGLQRDAVYLVRPDGYVALADPASSAKALMSYLDAREFTQRT